MTTAQPDPCAAGHDWYRMHGTDHYRCRRCGTESFAHRIDQAVIWDRADRPANHPLPPGAMNDGE